MEEIWKDIPGFEGRYQASNLGNIRSLNYARTGKIKNMTLLKATNGYLFFNYNTKHISVSRSVAKTFPEICGEWFEGCCVDHINTIRTDNRAENLRVCTMKENQNNPLTKKHLKKYSTEEERIKAKKESKKKDNQRYRLEHKEYFRNYLRQYYLDHKKTTK